MEVCDIGSGYDRGGGDRGVPKWFPLFGAKRAKKGRFDESGEAPVFHVSSW